MAWDNVLHKRLRDICAYLWEDARACKRLVADALIDSSRINWDEPPALRWQSVIMECEKQGTLYKLCPVLLAEYPENTHLQEAVAPWMNITGGSAEEIQNQTKPKRKKPVEIPEEYVDDIADIPVTMESIRADLAWLSRQVDELKSWRKKIAVLAAKDKGGEEDEDTSNVSISLPVRKDK